MKPNKAKKIANAALPTTPLTNASTPPPNMDSDDEFMSGASSLEEDFGGTQDSDNDSLGDGEISARCHGRVFVRHNTDALTTQTLTMMNQISASHKTKTSSSLPGNLTKLNSRSSALRTYKPTKTCKSMRSPPFLASHQSPRPYYYDMHDGTKSG